MGVFDHMESQDAMSLSSIVHAMWDRPAIGTAMAAGSRPSVRVLGEVRLDAQPELAQELGAGDERGLALVARAYTRWRSGFAEHLVGDFAIVVIDRAAGLVVAARDAFGVRRLAYRRVPDGIALSADVGMLAALGSPREDLDEDAIAGYLAGAEQSNERTLFRGVFRVPPGHTLIARKHTLSLHRHFTPSFAERRGSRADTVAMIGASLRTAVADRVRSDRPLLVHVSGGIDSSSIACIADGLGAPASLHFVAARFRGADEQRFVSAVDAQLRTRVHIFDAEPSATIDDVLDPGHPARYPLAAQTAGMEALAARTGASAVLSGIGGDELFFERGIYRDLAAHLCWRTLWRETGQAGGYTVGSRSFYLRDALQSLITRSAAYRSLAARRLAVLLGMARSRRRERRPGWLRAWRRGSSSSPTISPTAAADGATPAPFTSETQQFTWEWMTSARLVATLEAEDRTAASAGLEMRYPFLDTRLARVILATPYTHRLPGARMKALLRDAMGDTLPQAVRERSVVTLFDTAIATAIAAKLPALREAVERGPWESDRWVDREAARTLLRRVDADPLDTDLAIALWDVATLELWLRALG
jgi:asparagine synthase (glutamine-hydrolysing)